MSEYSGSGYEDAPKLYWKVAARLPGWRGEVALWASLLAIGLVVGFISGRVL